MDKVLELVDKILPERKQKKIIRHYHDEKPEVYKKRVSAEFEVAKPMFLIGVKDMDISADATIRTKKAVAMEILTDMLFGDTSSFAIDVYESGLVNGFDASCDHAHDSSKIFLEGECDNPEEVYDHFIAYLDDIRKNGLSREDFDRVKRASYASYIKIFDSTRLADRYTFMLHDDCDPFDYGDALKAVTFEDVEALFPLLFKEEYFAMSVVNPIAEA
jgi:predicted Zn-dependent peptidase